MPPKQTCSECGRLLRLKWFTYNPILNKRLCKRCDNKIGHNQFFEPKIKGSKSKRKYFSYAITKDESDALLRKKGNNEDVKFLKHYINKFYQRKRYEQKIKKYKDKEKQKNFIKGLNDG